MNFLLSPSGTEGDVRPTLVLANFLKKKGHDVIYCAPPNSLPFIEKQGFSASPLSEDYKKISTITLKQIMDSPILRMKLFTNFMKQDTKGQFAALEEMVKNADFIISTGLNFAAAHVAEFYGKPHIHVFHAYNILRNKHEIPVTMPFRELPSCFCGIAWKLNDAFFNNVKKIINSWRIAHGMKAINNVYDSLLSNTVISTDKDLGEAPTDRQENYLQTFYWHFDDGCILDDRTNSFIEDGEKPVYIGFGSMPGNNEQLLRKALPHIAEKLNLRFIVANGWGYKLDDIESNRIHVVDFAPHIKLFPKMLAAIHHGASGTTHAAALAGIPQILVPHGLDQHSWAYQVYKLGIGPKPINILNFSEDKLYKTLAGLLANKDFFANASSLGKQLQNYDRNTEMERLYSWIMKVKDTI